VSGDSTKAVYTAIGANSVVAVAKLGAFGMTGSGAMLSEGIHSVADVANQCLLALGLSRSRRSADDDHPYGYDKERFVWALISAVGIFFIGCGVTIYHGIHSILENTKIENADLALWVLAFSFLIEGASLIVAIRSIQAQAQARNQGFSEFVAAGTDPAGAAILLEDGAAVLGVLIAAACVGLGIVTGQAWWDGVGSILIGLLLGWVALWLINRNRQALVGQGVSLRERNQVIDLLVNDPVVDDVQDVKTTMVGHGTFRFKAEIDFDGAEIARRWLEQNASAELSQLAADSDQFRELLIAFGDELMGALGEEIDRLEEQIKASVPSAQHVDIEAD
jgi:zinc transporter 9